MAQIIFRRNFLRFTNYSFLYFPFKSASSLWRAGSKPVFYIPANQMHRPPQRSVRFRKGGGGGLLHIRDVCAVSKATRSSWPPCPCSRQRRLFSMETIVSLRALASRKVIWSESGPFSQSVCRKIREDGKRWRLRKKLIKKAHIRLTDCCCASACIFRCRACLRNPNSPVQTSLKQRDIYIYIYLFICQVYQQFSRTRYS